jgi:hypothetical protein
MIPCRIPISEGADVFGGGLLDQPEQGADGGVLVRQGGRLLGPAGLEQLDDHLRCKSTFSVHSYGSITGLPYGIFSKQKKNWVIFLGLAMEGIGIFYGHLAYITAI